MQFSGRDIEANVFLKYKGCLDIRSSVSFAYFVFQPHEVLSPKCLTV